MDKCNASKTNTLTAIQFVTLITLLARTLHSKIFRFIKRRLVLILGKYHCISFALRYVFCWQFSFRILIHIYSVYYTLYTYFIVDDSIFQLSEKVSTFSERYDSPEGKEGHVGSHVILSVLHKTKVFFLQQNTSRWWT